MSSLAAHDYPREILEHSRKSPMTDDMKEFSSCTWCKQVTKFSDLISCLNHGTFFP